MVDLTEIEEKTRTIQRGSVVVDGHCHLMKDSDERGTFPKYHLPLLRQGGVQVLLLIMGGDNSSMIRGSDLMLWGALEMIDNFYQELETCGNDFAVCTRFSEIERTLQEGRIAVLMGLEGGRPLEGRPMEDSLSSLRTFYRLGIRSVQLTGNGRNRLADGIGEVRSNGGLTRFGVSVVQELNRLGMLIDISHLAPAGVFHVLDLAEGPIVASHSNARSVCDVPRNLTDEVIKRIAEKGGVIGLSFFSPLVTDKKELATVEDLVDHIDHIANLAGIDFVGLGPDFSEFSTRATRWSEMSGRGYEGIQYDTRRTFFHPELKNWSHLPKLTASLLKRGYSDESIRKILGENFLRVYKSVLSS